MGELEQEEEEDEQMETVGPLWCNRKHAGTLWRLMRGGYGLLGGYGLWWFLRTCTFVCLCFPRPRSVFSMAFISPRVVLGQLEFTELLWSKKVERPVLECVGHRVRFLSGDLKFLACVTKLEVCCSTLPV